MDTLRHLLATVLVVSIPPAMIFWLVGHQTVALLRKLGLLRSYALLSGVVLLSVLPLVRFRALLVGADLGRSQALAGLGVVLWIGSIYLEVKCRKHLTLKTLVGVPEFRNETLGEPLLTEGIYGSVRHPRYVSVIVGVFGAALWANYSGAYILAALTVPALYWITILEERELLDRYGSAYRAYRSQVPRFIPNRQSRR